MTTSDATLCQVLAVGPDRIRFAVDPVPVLDEPLEERSAEAAWQAVAGAAPAFAEGPPRVIRGAGHGLLQAVATAHRTHRCLVLTPDTIGLVLAQGLARHVNEHPEGLREHLGVDFAGRRTLAVAVLHLDAADGWRDAVARLAAGLAEAHPEAAALTPPGFSTTDDVARTVRALTQLNAMKQYYDFLFDGICGIREVELRGTEADWVALERWATEAALPGLERWLDRVRPIVRALAASRSGTPDLGFWQGVYQQRDVYGGTEFTGWVGELFPYLGNTGTQRNDKGWRTIDRLPDGVLAVDVTLNDAASGTKRHRLLSGFVGATLEDDDLQPALGWAVLPATGIAEALDAVAHLSASGTCAPHERFIHGYSPKSGELVELADRAPRLVVGVGDRAVRFEAPWAWSLVVKPSEEHDDPGITDEEGLVPASFPGGCLFERAVAMGRRLEVWAYTDDGALRAVAPSWAAWLHRVKETADPLYFLENEVRETGWVRRDDADAVRWDGRAADWELQETEKVHETRLVLDLRGTGLRTLAFLRRVDAAVFRTLPLAEAKSRLASLDSWVLRPGRHKADDWTERLEKLGVPVRREQDSTLHVRARHLPTDSDWMLLPDEIIDDMRRAGVGLA